MSLTFKTGDMFQENADAIVNTVNCVGVMGKGVALEFKHRWPDNFRAYKRLCDRGELRPGKVYIHQEGDVLNGRNRFLINFPTKDHWRAKSKIEFIDRGLDDFVVQVKRLQIKSVAMPPLGCGNGGLEWSEVKALITKKLSAVQDVDFVVFAPGSDPLPQQADVRMTFERALLLKAFNDLAVYFDGRLTRITMQKITYFLQEVGVGFGLNFARNEFGPYSPELRDAFESMERQGLIEGFTSPDRETVVTRTGIELAKDYLKGEDLERAEKLIERVGQLVDGYESPYGLELLSSVHFLATRENHQSLDGIVEALGQWGESKGSKFDPAVVSGAYQRLTEDQFVQA
jgi:O-acetyl-ADP-ribose deacetylase (regulator of RNase III)